MAHYVYLFDGLVIAVDSRAQDAIDTVVRSNAQLCAMQPKQSDTLNVPLVGYEGKGNRSVAAAVVIRFVNICFNF